MTLSIQEEIQKLEDRIKNYQNNYDIAVKSGNSNRQNKYRSSILTTEKEIIEMKRKITPESNKILQEIVEKLRNEIENLDAENAELTTQIKDLRQKIDEFTKPKQPTEIVPLETVYICECGRSFNTQRGLSVHKNSCEQK